MDGMVNEFYEPVECSTLDPDEKEQIVSRAVFEQVMWERDIALEQLAEIGKGLGEGGMMFLRLKILFTVRIVLGTNMLTMMVMILRYAIIIIGK